MEKLLVVDKAERDKWKLLKRIDKKILDLVKFFKPHFDRLYATLTDGRFIAVGDNYDGLLGVGHQRVVKKFEEVTTLRGKSIKDIACGSSHVLVLTEDGQVWAWGQRQFEGDTEEGSFSVPRLVLDGNVKMIKCGTTFSLALTTDGKVFVWGDGWLGIGDQIRKTRKPVQILSLKDEEMVLIETGTKHSIAVNASGQAYGWGGNHHYQLGIGTKENQVNPVRLNVHSKPIKSVACGYHYTLFLAQDGTFYKVGEDMPNPLQLKVGHGELGEHILCLDYFWYTDRTPSDRLFLMWTSSGRVFYWEGKGKPRNTNTSLTEFLTQYTKEQFFPTKLHLIDEHHGSIEQPSAQNSNCRQILTQLFDSSHCADVEFVFENSSKTIRVHRNILSASSPQLFSQLPAEDATSRVTRVTPRDYPYPVYYQYLSYLYTCSLPPLQLDEIVQLLRLARDKNEVTLQEDCVRCLSVQLSLDTACRIYETAIDLGLKSLDAQAYTFITSNLSKVKHTEGFKQMNSTLQNSFSN